MRISGGRSHPREKMRAWRTFTGATGGRTRDLRRDRPVLLSPGWPGVCGDYRRKQAFRPWSCGDWRVQAGASGSLVRDQCRMRRCPGSERCRMCAGCRPCLPSVFPRVWASARLDSARIEREHARSGRRSGPVATRWTFGDVACAVRRRSRNREGLFPCSLIKPLTDSSRRPPATSPVSAAARFVADCHES
jgi:hypothetical protein